MYGRALLLLALALTGCSREPKSIRIKGPRDAVESTKMTPQFAPFEKKGDTIQLRASGFDDQDRYIATIPVKWDSSDREVATVSQTGVVTFLSTGKVKISAQSTETETPLEASIDLEAIIVKDIRLVDPPKEQQVGYKLPMGEIRQLKAEVLDDRGEVIPDAKIEWRVSSYAVTVTPTGEMEARAIGTAQVVAEAENGSSARLDVEVTDWEKKKKSRRSR
jgi:uncharacterized protein YjdB